MNVLPAHKSHPRIWDDFQYVYPVLSRRSRGISIGLNTNPDKVCNVSTRRAGGRLPPLPRQLTTHPLSASPVISTRWTGWSCVLSTQNSFRKSEREEHR